MGTSSYSRRRGFGKKEDGTGKVQSGLQHGRGDLGRDSFFRSPRTQYSVLMVLIVAKFSLMLATLSGQAGLVPASFNSLV